MLIKSFRHWLSKVSELSASQREQALEKLGPEHPPKELIDSVVKAPPVCPRCHQRPCGRWGQALMDGATVRQAAHRCAVHKDTAFRWRHRFLVRPAKAQPTRRRQGIVEADETYFLESHKGERELSRASRRRGGVAGQRGLSPEQIPVLIARDRSAATLEAVLKKATSDALYPVLQSVPSALREIDPFVLSKADPLCAQSFVEMGSEEKAGSFAGSV
jgi:hypothetical protein